MMSRNVFFALFIKTRVPKYEVRNITRYLSVSSNYASKETSKTRYKVHVIPALSDNYMYILIDKLSQSAIAIDPVEPKKIFDVVQVEMVNLEAVLTTHHHLDHAGGNDSIANSIKNIPIYGGDDRINSMTNKLSHNETIHFGDLAIKCLHTPCHTSGHVCYFTKADNLGYVCFTGDTLFVGGCGRFFEGNADHMLKSLNILSALPSNTLIYCGHEYTVSNLKFALTVEPENLSAKEKLRIVERKLMEGEPSVPTTLEEELKYNPFLRTNKEAVQQYAKETDPISVMKVLRENKDKF